MTDLAWRMHTKVAKQRRMKWTFKINLLQNLKHLCKTLAWLNNRNQGQELSKMCSFFFFFCYPSLNNFFSYSYKNHKNKQNVVKALMKRTVILRGWEMYYSCQRTVRRLLFGWFCLAADHNSTSLATPVAPVSSTLQSGHDKLMGHSLAVLGQTQETHEVDETSGKVQLAAKLAGCIVIGERVVVIVKSFTWKEQETMVNNSYWKQHGMVYQTCPINKSNHFCACKQLSLLIMLMKSTSGCVFVGLSVS